MEDDTATHNAKRTNNRPKKNLLIIGIVIALVVVVIAIITVAASSSSTTNPLSNALHVGSSFKDIGKTYTGAGGYSYVTMDTCTGQLDNSQCTPSNYYGNEAITLEKVIDPAQGINNTDAPDPGTRFVVAEFKQENKSNIALADGVISSATVQGSQSFTTNNYDLGPVLFGSDGQLYQPRGGTKTTPGCPAFPENTNGFSSSGNELKIGQSVTGCYRYDLPTSVKISYFQFAFDNPSSPTAGPFTTVTWTK